MSWFQPVPMLPSRLQVNQFGWKLCHPSYHLTQWKVTSSWRVNAPPTHPGYLQLSALECCSVGSLAFLKHLLTCCFSSSHHVLSAHPISRFNLMSLMHSWKTIESSFNKVPGKWYNISSQKSTLGLLGVGNTRIFYIYVQKFLYLKKRETINQNHATSL